MQGDGDKIDSSLKLLKNVSGELQDLKEEQKKCVKEVRLLGSNGDSLRRKWSVLRQKMRG